jgi:hypothetical protein
LAPAFWGVDVSQVLKWRVLGSSRSCSQFAIYRRDRSHCKSVLRVRSDENDQTHEWLAVVIVPIRPLIPGLIRRLPAVVSFLCYPFIFVFILIIRFVLPPVVFPGFPSLMQEGVHLLLARRRHGFCIRSARSSHRPIAVRSRTESLAAQRVSAIGLITVHAANEHITRNNVRTL